MENSAMFGIHLETDDRTREQRQRQRAAQNDRMGSAQMDSNYQNEVPESNQVRFNGNFNREIQGEVGDRDTFSMDRLFEAVASGDVKQLEDLHHHLQLERKRLSDTLYQSHGKSALMKALLHLKDGKNETVELLIDISEKMGDIDKFVNLAYTNIYYEGQTALHIAIERRSIYYVKLLVNKGADVHAKACGTFFQQHNGPNFYFGELPLSLAACTNQPDVVDFLMEQKTDPRQTDSQGNTVLHALVVVADNSASNTEFITRMYDRILRKAAQKHPKLKLEDIANKQGLTPLKMAAKTGKIELFTHILKREFQESEIKHLSRKFTEWVYGPVTSSLYDLASVDSCEQNSVLDILVYGSDIPNRHEMLQTELLGQLLDLKWKRFAGRMFFLNFLIYVVYLIIFTAVAYNKRDEKTPFSINHTPVGYLYVVGQGLTVLANCYFFITGALDMKRKEPKLQTLLIDGYYEILFFFQGFLFLVSAGLYVFGRREYLGFLVLCLALSWVNVLYYSRGHKHMGVYSIMIQKMILIDIMRFLFVYAVFLFGFSAAVVTLLTEPPEEDPQKTRLFGPVSPGAECVKPTFRSISYTTLELFKFTIGMGDMEFTEHYEYKEVFYVLLIGYIILTYILLLNMLIALMNSTVERTAMESTSIWKLQRAITILDMEKRLPCCLRKRLRCGVEINLRTSLGEDRRWCFRVEEVNWNKWNSNLCKINEDPGCWDHVHKPASDTHPDRLQRGRSWRGLFRESRWQRQQTHQSTEMSPLTTTPV